MFSREIQGSQQERKENNFYVSMEGSDHWSGSQPDHLFGKNGPFRSIGKAMSLMQAGDTCYIREGTYRECIRPLFSGKPGNNLVIKNYENERVIISACNIVGKKWKVVEKNIYKTDYKESEFRKMVFIDGQLTSRSRWPNDSGDLFTPVYATVDSGNFESLEDSDIPGDFSLEGCEMEALLGKEWALQYYTIAGFDPKTGILTYPAPGQRSNYYAPKSTWDDNYAARKDNRYYLLGHYDLLDVDGEWYFDRVKDDLYLYSSDGVNPYSRAVELKARDYCIDLSDLSHIEISGLELFGGGILTNEQSSNCMLRELNGFHVDPGVFISGNGNELNSCELCFCKGMIVDLKGNNNRIINNYIHDGNYSGSWDQILSVHGFRNLISNNTISRAGGGCILVSGKENIYQYNDISYAGLVRYDIGAMYCANNSGENSIIAFNKVHDINGMGIYLDNSTSNYLIHHNLIYNCTWKNVVPHAPMGHVISNFSAIKLNTPGNFNLVYNNTTYGSMSFDSWGRNFSNDMYGDQMINNIFTGTIVLKDSSIVLHNIYQGTDPLYQDPENLIFLLSAHSPAIDNGVKLKNISDSFTGKAPDMGAFEYGEKPWKAGHDFDHVPNPVFRGVDVEYRNLVENGGFEEGFDAWKFKNEKKTGLITENSWGIENARTRMQNRSVGIEEVGAELEQTITGIAPKTMYVVSAWIKAPGKGVSGRLILSAKEGVILSKSIDSQGWKFFSSTFISSANDTVVKIKLEKEGDGLETIYFDDIGLIKKFDLSSVSEKKIPALY